MTSACSNNAAEEELSEAQEQLDCVSVLNGATATTVLCINRTAGHYVYDDQYGGRYTASSNTINASNGAASVVIPTGWYDVGGGNGGTVNFADSNIAAGVIASAVNLFGTVGVVVTAAEAACILVSGGGLRSVDCSAARDDYFYTTAFGGRSLDCTNEGQATTNTQPCWVDANGYRITTTLPVGGGSEADCAVQGQQGAACRGNATTYWYNQPFGGRDQLCTIGFNSAPCWLEPIGYYITTAASGSTCVDNNLNTTACDTQPGRYVYNEEYGDREENCTNDLAGGCFVTGSTKQSLEPNLVSDKIAKNVSIFGIVGSYSGNGDWGSGAHRNIDTSQIGSAAEAGQYAGNGSLPNLPAGYRSVPKIATDDDGYDTSNLNVETVDRNGWGTTTCGLTQATVIDRIEDCSDVFGANARWNGTLKGNAGQGIWNLVSRSGAKSGNKAREVWRDERTGLLWSSVIGTAANWCKASGSNNATNVLPASIRENDPSDICDAVAQTYQSTSTAISGCFEGTGITTTDAAIDNAGKVGMNLAGSGTSPKVAWRLPTLYDYEVADANGMRLVLADIGINGNLDEWTATISSSIRSRAWIYNGAQGVHSTKARTLTSAFRCVGR